MTYFPLEGAVHSLIAADDATPFLETLENKVLGYQKELRQSRESVIRIETVDGQASDVMQIQMSGDTSATELPMHAFVSQSTGLPLKEVVDEQGEFGGLQEVETHTIS